MIKNTDTICSITKQCKKCEQTKPLTEFYITPKSKNGYRGDGWRGTCKMCWALYAKQYRLTKQGQIKLREASIRFFKTAKGNACRERYRKSEAYKETYRKVTTSKYGITIAEYDEMFAL